MNPFRVLASFTVAVCLSTFAVIACHDEATPSATTPPPSAAHHKMGMDINNANELGAVVVESGLFEWPRTFSDGADSGGAMAEQSIGLIGPGPYAIPISACQFHTNAAVTASNTAYATLNVYKRNGTYDGAAGTLIATVSTTIPPASDAGVTNASGNWLQFSNVTIPASTGAYVSPGDSVTFSISKTSTGVAIPAGQLACFTTMN